MGTVKLNTTAFSPARRALGLPIFGAFAAAVLSGLLLAGPVKAGPLDAAPLSNVVSLSANGFLEARQDWLVLRMSVTKEGQDAVAVQNQLRLAMESALSRARGAATGDQQLQARSGAFGVYPRHDKSGKISSWQGTAELVMEGRDFARIAKTASKIEVLTVAGMDFSLSQETQQKLETEVQALAIQRFKSRALEIAKGFGFANFGLREINVSSAEDGGRPSVRHSAMKSFSSESLPMEPGVDKVNVTVSGTVVLR